MAIADLLATANREKRTVLTEVESKELIREAGIPVVETRLARSEKEAIRLAKLLGFPVVLKIVSPNVIHKSDIGGVKVGLTGERQVAQAYNQIMHGVSNVNPSATIHGVSVQPMALQGIEVIIGMYKDSQFGPLLMFGLGGIMVEVLKDVAFRLVPLTRRDARNMIREIKAYPLLDGYRGRDPADTAALEVALLSLSEFIEKHPSIKEVDLNPILAYKEGLLAVDARVILEEDQG
ncbi:MAG: acetate--CoA ligase family protein [Chloroflexi bacterium]|nr:acetate--CoA ligase family protein [Chloroflexota bacterium]